MANLRVELRKRTGSTYGDKVLVATETSLVEGLLNPDGKIKENLFPTSVFGWEVVLGNYYTKPEVDTLEINGGTFT